jgi:hypothetical protein
MLNKLLSKTNKQEYSLFRNGGNAYNSLTEEQNKGYHDKNEEQWRRKR